MRFASHLLLSSICHVLVIVCLLVLAGCDAKKDDLAPVLNELMLDELMSGKASHNDKAIDKHPFGIGGNPGMIGEITDDGTDSLKKMLEDEGVTSFGEAGSSKNYSPGDSCIGAGLTEDSLNNQPSGFSPTGIMPLESLQGTGGSLQLDGIIEPDG